jgi:hypothetical protein
MTHKTRLLLLVLFCFAPVWANNESDLLAELRRTRDASKALALAARGEAALPHLIKGLEDGGRCAALCAWALYQHPQPGASKALRGLLTQSDQVAGYWAAMALGKIKSPENVAALSALLPDERLAFWELAAGGVGRLTDVFLRDGRRINAPAPDWMPNLRVAYAAMEALGEIGGTQSAATLLRGLSNDQYLIRYGAARGLGRMRYEPALPVLSAIAQNDRVLLVRLAAQKAMRAIREGETPVEPLGSAGASPSLPPAIVFVKTTNRSDANLGFRESYFFPKTPWYGWGENLYTLTPPRPDGVLKNLTNLQNGLVQGPEVSYDGKKILFGMRKDAKTDGFHLYEINVDGAGLKQLTFGNCNDVDPHYLPDGRIIFSSDRCGTQEYYHQERSRTIYTMNADGSNVQQVTFNPNQDYEPIVLSDGRVLYSSYRFYAQDGSEGPMRGEWMGLARMETILRTIQPDGTGDNLFYGSARGSFYAPMRPMPFSDQFAGWHPRGYHVGVSVGQAREMPDGRVICSTPAGLTLLDTAGNPMDCEIPIYPEVVNLAGGEEVYIHNYDDMNPVGRFTTPYPLDNNWVFVSHAPWHQLGGAAYGIHLLNLQTREMRLVYDDPTVSDVDPIPIAPRRRPPVISSLLPPQGADTGLVYGISVFNSDLPFDRKAVKYIRVIEGLPMGLSINANAAFRTRILGTVPIQPDGSFYIEAPADTPIRFELLDEDERMLVHETEFNYVRGGEKKACVGCHEPKGTTPAGRPPLALSHPPAKTLRRGGDLIYMGQTWRPYNTPYRQ